MKLAPITRRQWLALGTATLVCSQAEAQNAKKACKAGTPPPTTRRNCVRSTWKWSM